MKKFTIEEIRDLFGQVVMGEISLSRMVEILNERVSEAEEKKCVEDIPKLKFKKGDKVRIKDGISSRTAHGQYPVFQPSMDDFISTTMTVNRYVDMNGCVVCNESGWRFHEDWLEPYIEDIPVRKFKKGDKVRIKDGFKPEEHRFGAEFVCEMDKYIGKDFDVDDVEWCYIISDGWSFNPDWLEPYVEELKKGDLAIFWDSNKGSAFIGEYDCFLKDVKYPHRDHRENVWANAIKFESIEQYKRLLKGEI